MVWILLRFSRRVDGNALGVDAVTVEIGHLSAMLSVDGILDVDSKLCTFVRASTDLARNLPH